MINRLSLSLTICFLLTTIVVLLAQKPRKKYISDSERFSAGLVLGFNNAQMDGDYFKGFNKYGLTGGIRSITRLTPRLNFNIEMLYSKKGSKIPHTHHTSSQRIIKDRIINLGYVDVPIFLKYLLKDQDNAWHLEVGGIYSRLVQTKITERVADTEQVFAYQSITEEFDKNDISTLFGLGYSWKNGISLNFRYTFGLKKFYETEVYTQPSRRTLLSEPVNFLRNYYYTIHIAYDIFRKQ